MQMKPCTAGPVGGLIPRGWPDVLAFAQATRAVSDPWEMTALVHMSAAYVEERAHGTDLFRKSPMERATHG